jgi:hypothetical protein
MPVFAFSFIIRASFPWKKFILRTFKTSRVLLHNSIAPGRLEMYNVLLPS